MPRTTPPRRGVLVRLLRGLLLLSAVAVAVLFGQMPAERPQLVPRDGPAIGAARSWGYQLQHVSLRSVSDGLDVLVVDYSRDGSERRVFRGDEVAALRTRADGSKRIVLAYMSIGEAENYRFYWRRGWVPGNPSWLGAENREWRGNFPVRYWERGWRDLIMQREVSLLGRLMEAWQPSSRPYLDRIIEAGFDGVYLDRVDVFDLWKAQRPTAEAEMAAFVRDISAYAKQRRPGFLVVPQNGEELLRFAEYRQAIDAAAKEDLMFGIKGDGTANDAEDVRRSSELLAGLRRDGRPVFVVEYLADPAKRAEVARALAPQGFIVQFADRELRHAPE